MVIPFRQNFSLVKETLKQLYQSVEPFTNLGNNSCLRICENIVLTQNANDHLTMEWTSDPVNDMIADSVIAVLSQIEMNPMRATTKTEATIQYLYNQLKNQFVEVECNEKDNIITIIVDQCSCVIDFASKVVHCEDNTLREHVETYVKRLEKVNFPLSCH